MILSGKKIMNEIRQGRIIIDPFDENKLNPNSYNLTLGDKLVRYTSFQLDMKKDNEYEEITIPDNGFLLQPGRIYLGRTVETTSTPYYVPMIEGRSSIGRLGVFVHITAGFGDVGYNNSWTLEIACLQPVVIYPYIEICQIYYHTIDGPYELYGENKPSKYNGQNNSVSTSQMFKELN